MKDQNCSFLKIHKNPKSLNLLLIKKVHVIINGSGAIIIIHNYCNNCLFHLTNYLFNTCFFLGLNIALGSGLGVGIPVFGIMVLVIVIAGLFFYYKKVSV